MGHVSNCYRCRSVPIRIIQTETTAPAIKQGEQAGGLNGTYRCTNGKNSNQNNSKNK